jgi:hypothetical protein
MCVCVCVCACVKVVFFKQILPTLNLLDITSKFHTIAGFIIVDLQIISSIIFMCRQVYVVLAAMVY